MPQFNNGQTNSQIQWVFVLLCLHMNDLCVNDKMPLLWQTNEASSLVYSMSEKGFIDVTFDELAYPDSA